MDKTMLKFKIEGYKRKAKAKVDEAWQLCKEHPEEAFMLATTVAGSALGLARRHDRNVAMKREQELKDRYIYDRSIGKYWKTRKAPSVGEQLEIERRKRNGESMGDILSSMRLL